MSLTFCYYSFLLWLGLCPEWLSQVVLELFILDVLVRVELRRVKTNISGNDLSRSGEHDNGGLKLSDVFAGNFLEDWVGNEHIVVAALLDTDLGASLVFECTDCKWKGWESFVDLNKEGS